MCLEVGTVTSALCRSSALYFAHPSVISDKVVVDLDRQKRWWCVTVPDVEQAEFTHFSWILPSELVGDTIFSRLGGFAYNRRQSSGGQEAAGELRAT